MTVFRKIVSLLLICVFVFGALALPSDVKAAGDKVVITLDPGHGGPKDPGACHGQTAEKTLTLTLAQKIKAILEANGNFTVYLTRTGDTALTKAQRLKIANDYNTDFLISIHFDGNNNPAVNGVTVYTSVVPEFSPNALAASIASNLSSVGFANNGVKQNADPDCYWNSNKQWDIYDPSVGIHADYYGAISWGCKFGFPAIIVEHGYLSNSRDVNHILSEGTLDRMAEAEAGALISYYTGHTHTYGAVSVDFPSNCAIQGKSSSKCTICRHRKNVTTLPADPDNHYYYSDAIVSHKVSCDTEESVSYKCRISENFIEKELYCEEHVLVDVLKPKTDHNYVVTFHQEVAHAVDGITRYSCTNCASNYTETVAAEGHTWVMKHTSPATCEANGAVTYICPECQEEYSEKIPAFGHSYVRTELIKDATCLEAGLEKVRCSTCEKETEREIAALGHLRYVLEHVDSTCSVQGYDKCFCNRCQTEYTEEIEKPSHEFEVILDTEVSCTVDGKTVSKCNLCGEEKTDIKALASHKYEVTEEVAPTCDGEGYVLSTCSVCDEVSKEPIPPAGHKWEEPVCTKRATAFTSGNMRTVCTVDENHFYDEELTSRFASDNAFRWEIVLLGIFLLIALADALLVKFKVIPYGAAKKAAEEETANAEAHEESMKENAGPEEADKAEEQEKEPAAAGK
ncbi:MAG: N-acetylmuramoyl-L-alanine amidase [Ruminococcaceae bacterium]|nr:N-acetylmuramoyl-L-alanine amidase [Oscillospiraceae bacterium]